MDTLGDGPRARAQLAPMMASHGNARDLLGRRPIKPGDSILDPSLPAKGVDPAATQLCSGVAWRRLIARWSREKICCSALS